MIRPDKQKPGNVAPAPPPLSHWLRDAARRAPQVCAVLTAGRHLNYAELLAETDTLAAQLRAKGFAPGDRVAIAAIRSIDTIVAILATIEAGLGYVPLDLNYPPDRLQAMLEDASPRAVLGEPAALATLRAAVGDFPTLEQPAAALAPPHAATPDLAYVLFTSGSTGRPKGVAMGALPLRHLTHWHAQHPRLGQSARVLQFAPLSFDVHFQEIFSTLACAGTLVLVPEAERRDPSLLLAALVQHQVERIFVPYVALQMIADAARHQAPAALRDVISAGEQLQVTPAIRSLFMRLPGAELHNHYGPTESHVVTAHELRGDPAAWPEIPPIGLPLPHVQLALLNVQADAPDGSTTGELLLGGETLAHGYLGRPELTAERFRSDFDGLSGRWYVAGDLVRRDEHGVHTYLGRADQQLKVDGFRIEPGEIELAMMAHASVQDAVVTAPDLPGIGRQLVAHIVVREAAAVDAAALITELRAHLRACLPEYMVPVRFVTLERLPTTPSGKIDRRALPMPALESSAPASTDPLTLARSLWQDLLGLPQVADDDNLFDLGARSLLVMRFVTRLKELGVLTVSVADVYDRPTVAGIAAAMEGLAHARKPRGGAGGKANAAAPISGIAIVGMATRTPGASDVEAFWRQLVAGEEGIRHFALDELDASVPESLRARPNFVAAHGMLQDVDRFDAAYFGISAREATMLDPQQRLMLELCVSALEHAAIDPSRADVRVGVYVGTGNNAYAPALRHEQPELVQQYGEFATMLASEKDYVATRVANRLDLNGPALSIHTACSTSLVAVAQAWHALADGQCDVALAGGVNVAVPQASGYLHVEGGMESADGHCRPFDADASGTVFSSGGGVVVLRRLEDALASGDTVFAVIRGVGLNNDGGDKASFTAPSVSGQAGAIRMALDHAQLDARSIGYVEAHGTGTSLGDPIEVAALTRAWREDTAEREFCGIGSVKSNLGHMAAGAGVVGLIKTALSLHRELIPATLHFKRPNPQIDFASTPFKVVARNAQWPRESTARRAAVSSFGVGGTNAHVVIEEAPAMMAAVHADAAGPRRFVLPLSARTAEDAVQRARDLADHLQQHPHAALAEVAATLMRGRRPMAQRLSVVAANAADAVVALRVVKSAAQALNKPRVVFLFPGQGSQHPGMARGLYDEAPAFREALDRALQCAQPTLAADLRTWLVDADPADAAAAQALAETRHAQPALFAVSHALASWLDSLGVQPDAMIGHSIGEYAAACHAGVFSVEAAMKAVLARGQAMFEQPHGAMLAVRTGTDTLQPLLPAGVEIAGTNAPALTVVAGSHAAIDAFAALLEARDIGTTRLRVSHAFHSASMDGALPRVAQALHGAGLHAPRSLMYSCISGAPLSAEEATDARYWARQVRAPVHFSRAVSAELARGGDAVFVEVGPGQALTALLRQHRTPQGSVPRIVPLLGTAADPGDAAVQAMTALGALWCAGVDVAWPVAASARRVPLPTYPFKGERYWFARRADKAPAPAAAALPPPPLASPPLPACAPPLAIQPPQMIVTMSRIPQIENELKRVLGDVSGLPADEMTADASFVDQGLDSLSLTQATLELERVFGVKLRFRRLLEDLDKIAKLAVFLDGEMPADKFAPPPAALPVEPAAQASTAAAAIATGFAPSASSPAPSAIPPHAAMPAQMLFMPSPAPMAGASAVHQLMQQQMQLMSQQLALLSGQAVAVAPVVPAGSVPAAQPLQAHASVPPSQPQASPQTGASIVPLRPAATAITGEAAQPSINSLVEKPFGASPRLTLEAKQDFTPAQRRWLDDFITRYNARSGKSKSFSQQHRKVMADPRVVTGFNPLWKDLVYPIVVDRSSGASLWDLDGNEYIDLLSCFGGNLLGYQPPAVIEAIDKQLQLGLEVGPQHPLAADVATLISEFTGMERVGFCNTGSEAVMGAMRIARTVTGRKTIAIFTNSYHGIFDEVIVRGTKQLRSLSAAPGILANAVENILVLDWNSEDSLRVLRERGTELAAIMTEPIQNKYPTVQPREIVQTLRQIADKAGCALIFDEVVTGFRIAPGGAQEFYGVRADIATYGKVIGGGLPFAVIAGNANWLDALDGGHWQYGDDSYPEAGVTYFAGTFVRHPLALAAAHATLLHLKKGGREFYRNLNDRTQRMVERLNTAFALRGAPVKAVHCTSLWRLQWDDNQKFVSLFYYLLRFHGLHVYEQFGHFVTEGMTDVHTDRIFQVFTNAIDELMGLGLITPRNGEPRPPRGHSDDSGSEAPLAPGQTERWLAASLDRQARIALNESLCLRLEGACDLAALEAAANDVLVRHESFRVRFSLDEPVQIVDASATLRARRIDLRSQPDADAALDRFCEQASRREFALDAAPFAELSLLSLADRSTVVHMLASHLIFDGWGAGVFMQELAAAYRARCAGRAPQFAPAGSPRAFAIAQQARWSGPEAAESMAFWSDALRNPPAPLLLGDREPPSPRQYSGDTLRAAIDGDLLKALQARAKAQKATLFQLLLGALAVTLQRRSGRDDFVVSVPFATQSMGRNAALVTDGVVDLPLRLHCSANAGFDLVLADVRTRLMDALDQPFMTQAKLARALGIPSSGNRPPLTGILFNLNPRLDDSLFAPLRARTQEGRKLGLLAEVLFNFTETSNGLSLDLHHSTEFFSPARAAEVLATLQDVLHEVAGVAREASVQPADLAQIDRWNATERAYPAQRRLGDLIQAAARKHPHATAVRFEGQSLSYRELDLHAWALAGKLQAAGVGPGVMVGVCLERSVELVVALVGCAYSAGAYIPLDPQYPEERLAGMCTDASLTVIVTRPAEAAAAGSAFPANAMLLMLDAGTLPVNAAASGALQGTADDPAYAIFTSGSTGRPKGALNSHRGVVNWLQWMQDEYQLTPQDCVMQKTPYSFDVSLREFFWPLMVGATVVVARPDGHRDAEYIADLIASDGVTLLHFVPSMLRVFLDEPDLERRCSSLRRVVCSGEALPLDLVDQFFERLPHTRLCNLYGPTEAAVEVTYWECKARDPRRLVPIGHPVANTRMYVLDEGLKSVGIGRPGDLYIAGIQVGIGYLARPELTQERFLPDPFRAGERMYKTGDVARWLDDGAIEYLGRSDHQVKIRGNRIELGEIEDTLIKHPNVSRCVVVAHEFDAGDMRLVGYVVPRAAPLDLVEVKLRLGRHLPEVMVPQHYVTLADIPLLSNGKIDRKALPRPTLDVSHAVPAPAVQAAVAPAAPVSSTRPVVDDTEAAIAAAMAKLLKRPTVGSDENFFELGGHSLLAAQLSARIGDALGHRPGLRAIFEAPTAARLARLMTTKARQPARATQPVIPRRADQSVAPLSLMQQRMWFLENLTPGTDVNNIPTGHRLTGDLDVQAFERAFQMLLQRQTSLRTVIESTPSGDQQRVLDKLDFSLLPLEDLSDIPEPQRSEQLQRTISGLIAAPFDLRRGPLFRARLWRLGAQEHAFVFIPHHIVWDAWSFDLLYTEFAELYDACRGNREPKLAPLPVSYGDFAAWQLEWMSGPELKRQVDHWVQRLSPLPAALELPTDRPRPPVMTGKGGSHQFLLPPEVTDPLQTLASQRGTTLYVMLLSAYTLLLHRMSSQFDFVVGTPVRGREQAELEPLMGFFVNMLPLRSRFDAALTMREWVARNHELVLDSFAHPDVPFEHLVRLLNPPRDHSRPPVHQVSFSYQDVRERPSRWSNLEHARMATAQGGAPQDLALWCVMTRKNLEFVFTFNADVMNEPGIALIGQRLRSLLVQMVERPDQPVMAFDIIAPSEREKLVAWNGPALAAPDPRCVHALIQAQAERTPAAVALSQPGQASLDYEALDQASNRLAHLLRSRGVGRGALVGLCLDRTPDMVVAQLAVLKSGAGYVPLDPAYPTARLAYMAQDARLKLLVSKSDSIHALDWPRDQTVLLDIDSAAIDAQSASCLAPLPEQDARPADVAYVIYTSGSTGKPKGVSVPHRAVVNFLISMAREPGLSAGDRLLAVTTLSFDIAVLELLLPLTVGAEVVIAARRHVQDGNDLRDLLDDTGVTAMQATPMTWRMLLDAGWSAPSPFKALVGGEALPADLAATLLARGVELWNMYGPTETTVWSTCWKVEHPERGISIGRPIGNTQVHILDDKGGPSPAGVAGEICIGGTGVALGYLYRPELTAERFVADSFSSAPGARLYRTGDRGRWRPDGLLEHLGRLDNQVKLRGFRIELGEIEAALATHAQVAQCMVSLSEAAPGEARLVAHIVPRGPMADAAALRTHLRASLPEHMVPQHFAPLAAVPLLPNGKVDRGSLPVLTEAPAAANDDFVAPNSALEIAIAESWKGLLNVDNVGVNDNFFDLGGHSLLAMRAVTEINHRLGLSLNVRRLIFETLGQIAASAADSGGSGTPKQRRKGLMGKLFGGRKQ